ncbi:MJ0042-type zinc finger domain-containing protein [Erythrobacter ani]|uniref:MJ0042-type zinc finger domain-containing protein n=1 Tax=Erythrobacter ani TaxID=2827235 RepID=UPI003F6FEDDC
MPDTAIGIEGRTVRCAKCKHSWFQDGEPIDLPDRPAEAEDRSSIRPERSASEDPAPAAPPPAPPPPPVHEQEPPEPEPETPAATDGTEPAPSISFWRTDDRAAQGVHPADPVAGGIAASALKREESAQDHYEEAEAASEAESYEEEYTHDDPVEEAFDDHDYDDDSSQFDYAPPFSARRNPLKMWTIAAAIFALLATGTVFAVNYYGLPSWLPVNQPTFGIGKPDLTLEFPADQQRTEELETGTEIFRVRGTITNAGRDTVSVPSLLVVFSDERDRQVGTWPIVPAKRELTPGESLNVTEAISDVPAAAKVVEIGWAPN